MPRQQQDNCRRQPEQICIEDDVNNDADIVCNDRMSQLVYGMLTLVGIMLTIYDEFYACTADAILLDFEEVETIQQANQLALRDVNPTTRTLRELACGSNTR